MASEELSRRGKSNDPTPDDDDVKARVWHSSPYANGNCIASSARVE
jgi:hypothetical protein